MEVGLVRSIDIDQEMQQAYLDYAMSVIVARALPDARDGLKPVHRRILYAMYDMGMRPDAPYKKSARIVGEVLGKYHPHGDAAVYESMARMAQPFSMRYLLIDGQGNFGSVDGDPPAAMRYTEARLALPAMNMLADIQKNTVNFNENFDGSLREPDVLPAGLPNLLINGATGIAVGMSTSIPPHNLSEVVGALVYMLQRWDGLDDLNVEDLMRFIHGPDFPTGGVIVLDSEEDGLNSAYGTGRGRITVQARAHFEEMSRGRNRIIVTELPYMTNKSTLIERIADLAREERLEGVADLRDESDRQGLRIVIELNKTADPQAVLQSLYKSTGMKSTFGIIMLALVGGEPRMLSLKQALRVYLEHRLEIVRRRSEFDLERARHRAHILEGLRVALKNLDEVIALIRKAPDVETARTRLMKRFKLTEIQAQAILDMQLRRLAALERKKIEEEYKEVQALIKSLVALLRSPKKMRQAVAEELQAVKESYGDRRRTQIVKRDGKTQGASSFLVSDLTPQGNVWVSVTASGLISRSLDDNPPPAGGRDAPLWSLRVNTRDTLYLISSQGDAAGVPVHAIPETASPSAGAPAFKVSAFDEGDRVAGLFTLPGREERPEGWFVFSATRLGMVKKTAVSDLPGPTARTFSLMKVNESDRFGWVRLTDGGAEVMLATAGGMAIRFSEDEVRPMGLGAAGVGGIKLQGRDEVTGMDLVHPKGEMLLFASDGKAKRVSSTQFPKQGRYGMGVAAWKLPRTADLVGLVGVEPGRSTGRGALRLTLHLGRLAPRSIKADEIPAQTRAASGKAVAGLKVGENVTAVTAPYDLGSGGTTPVNGREKKAGSSRAKPAAKKAARTSAGKANDGKAAIQPPLLDLDEKPAAVKSGRAKSASAKPAGKATRASTTKASAGRAKAPARARKTASEPETSPGPKKASKTKAAAAEKRPSAKSKTTPKDKGKAAKPSATPAKSKAAKTQPASKEKASAAKKPTAGRAKGKDSARQSRTKPAARKTRGK